MTPAVRLAAAATREGASLPNRMAFLFVPNAARAMCYANRCTAIRGVVGTCGEAVEQGVTELGANFLVIEYPDQGPRAMAAMVQRMMQQPPGAPPVPRIAGDLVGQEPAPSAPAPARSQVAQSAAGQAQLRFPQFQGPQSQGPQFQAPQFQDRGAAVAPRLAALGAQLVAVIYFGHSSAQLDASDRAVLREVVALQRQRGGTIRVVGHASAHTGVVDQIKHRLANFEMSLKRANTVAAGLVALGAARDEVRAEAKGDAQPIFHEFMATGEAGNRRAEIFLEN